MGGGPKATTSITSIGVFGSTVESANAANSVESFGARGTGCDVSDQQEIKPRDLQTLAGIVRGPGFYASPSPDRIKRLLENRLIKQQRGTLRPTLKGRIVTLKGRLITIFRP